MMNRILTGLLAISVATPNAHASCLGRLEDARARSKQFSLATGVTLPVAVTMPFAPISVPVLSVAFGLEAIILPMKRKDAIAVFNEAGPCEGKHIERLFQKFDRRYPDRVTFGQFCEVVTRGNDDESLCSLGKLFGGSKVNRLIFEATEKTAFPSDRVEAALQPRSDVRACSDRARGTLHGMLTLGVAATGLVGVMAMTGGAGLPALGAVVGADGLGITMLLKSMAYVKLVRQAKRREGRMIERLYARYAATTTSPATFAEVCDDIVRGDASGKLCASGIPGKAVILENAELLEE